MYLCAHARCSDKWMASNTAELRARTAKLYRLKAVLPAIAGSRAPRFNNDRHSVSQVVALHAVLYVMPYASADANRRIIRFKFWMAQGMWHEVDLKSRSRGNTSSWSLTKSSMQSPKMSTSKYFFLSFHLRHQSAQQQAHPGHYTYTKG